MVLGESGGGERQQRQGSIPAAGSQTLSCQGIGNWFSKLCRHTQSLPYFLCLPFQLQPGLRLDPSIGRCPGRNPSHKSLFPADFPRMAGSRRLVFSGSVGSWSLPELPPPNAGPAPFGPLEGGSSPRGPHVPPRPQQVCDMSAALEAGRQALRSPPGPSEWTQNPLPTSQLVLQIPISHMYLFFFSLNFTLGEKGPSLCTNLWNPSMCHSTRKIPSSLRVRSPRGIRLSFGPKTDDGKDGAGPRTGGRGRRRSYRPNNASHLVPGIPPHATPCSFLLLSRSSTFFQAQLKSCFPT